jgi:hypothetical protein
VRPAQTLIKYTPNSDPGGRRCRGARGSRQPQAVRRPGARQPRRRGRAVQVDPIKPTLKAPGIECLKLQYDKPLSKFAFKFNLRATPWRWRRRSRAARAGAWTWGRGLHSFTSQLDLSACYGTRGARRGCVARVKGVFGGVRGCVGCFCVSDTAQVEQGSERV